MQCCEHAAPQGHFCDSDLHCWPGGPYLGRGGNRTYLCPRSHCTLHKQTPPCPLVRPRG